ncbi:microcephalin isoform X2 [Cimex lectularius]|uniref:BRCT domain-containing protein n=1 Tax=Cimex lectularius TaxID=79782 RepID=A0A8I6TDD8_CIMLE|nr:microcephalin isoform X2 [Cimex lectularius]
MMALARMSFEEGGEKDESLVNDTTEYSCDTLGLTLTSPYCPPRYSKQVYSVPSVLTKGKENQDFSGFESDSSSDSIGPFSAKKKLPPISHTGPKKSYVENVFDKYDDMYANLPLADGFTTPEPKKLLEKHRFQLKMLTHTPKFDFVPYQSEAEKSARRDAYIKEQKEYIEMTKAAKKLIGAATSEGCVTPVSKGTSQVQTPLTDRSNMMETSFNMSGIQLLDTPTSCSAWSPLNFLTPSNTTQEIPEEIKKSILLGVTCYVEVRIGRENRSECVKAELRSLGANVEKNFTKKVTIVVFKEGLVSTFLKAKELGVKMVSTFWIEACKVARGQVDPSLYPPLKMEKYESILPFEAVKKRRFRLPKRTKENQNPDSPTSQHPKRCRNAITDRKEIANFPKLKGNTKMNVCTKKLNFEKDSGYNHDFSLKSLNGVVRRDSAPAYLEAKINTKQVNNSKKTSGSSVVAEGADSNRSTTDKNSDVLPQKRKRKLLDPNKTYLSQGLPSNTEPLSVEMPYKDKELKPVSSEKAINLKSKQRSNLKSKLILNDQTMNNTLTRRSSMSLFVTAKKTPLKPYQHPTIVFTSFRGEELKNCEAIVQKLGVFQIEENVSKRTTHVVSKGPRRTINLLKGLARGCWIIDEEWLYKSDAAGTYVSEDQYELSSFSSAVVQSRLERRAFKEEYNMDLFSECGPIYVSLASVPPQADLTELLRICKGRVVTQANIAEIIIGGKRKNNSSVFRVKETWVLDSITQNTLLDINDYKY